jgi:seryl-tRNA synthetase
MIDIRLLRDAPDETRAALARRLTDLDGYLDNIIRLDGERRDIIQTSELLKAERNTASDGVRKINKEGGDASGLLAGIK